jgi:hypothetical protein
MSEAMLSDLNISERFMLSNVVKQTLHKFIDKECSGFYDEDSHSGEDDFWIKIVYKYHLYHHFLKYSHYVQIDYINADQL